jgi:hypothetical protein
VGKEGDHWCMGEEGKHRYMGEEGERCFLWEWLPVLGERIRSP